MSPKSLIKALALHTPEDDEQESEKQLQKYSSNTDGSMQAGTATWMGLCRQGWQHGWVYAGRDGNMDGSMQAGTGKGKTFRLPALAHAGPLKTQTCSDLKGWVCRVDIVWNTK